MSDDEWDVSLDDLEDDEPSNDPLDSGSLQLGSLLSTGASHLVSVTGAQLLTVITLVGLLSALFWQTVFAQVFSDFLRTLRENPELSDPEFQQVFADLQTDLDSMFVLDAPIPLVLVGLLVLAVLNEAVLIVAVRSFARQALDGIPGALARRRLPIATLYGFVGGVLLSIAVGVGTLLLIVPGLFIFVGTLFFRQEIAVADNGLFQAISGSWGLTKGNRWTLFGLLVLLWVLGLVVNLIFGAIPGLVGTVVNVIVTSIVSLYALAVVTDAYVRLGGDVTAEPDQSVNAPETGDRGS